MNEQAGIYAGDEGYDINVNKHTDLKGALITSTQKAEEDGKNHFSTSSLTHSDIENHSNYSGSSFGVSGSVSANFETPFGENGAAQSTKQASDKDGNLLYTDKNGNTTVNSKGVDGQENTKKLAEGKESLQFSYGMGYGKDSDSQSSTTKSGINTQNIIIKDEAEQLKRTGKTVQEEIAAIKTDITIESAQSQSGKLENRFNKDDVQKELDFQREVTEKFGPNVAEAGSLLANKFGEEAKAKRHEAAIALEEAEKAKAENNNETNRALVKQARDNFETASREAKEWETGGSQRLVIDSALNVISTALAGRPAAEVVASGLSPTVNNQIKKATTDAKGNVNTALNLTAHALWGAVEAYAGNRNVAAGAAGAAGGEAAAHFLASTLYDKSPEKLSEEEKRTVSSLSQVAAGIAGGSLSDSSDGAIIAAKTAKDSVENNALTQGNIHSAYQRLLNGEDIEVVLRDLEHLSQKERAKLLADCDAACRQVVPSLLMAANDFSEEQAIAIGSILSKIPADQRSRVDMLVQSENSKTLEAIENSKSDVEKHIALAVKVMRFFQAENAVSGGKSNKPKATSVHSENKDYSKDVANLGVNRNKGLNERISNRQKNHYIYEQQAAKNVHKVTVPIDFDGHILNVEINKKGKLVGGHSIANGNINFKSKGKPNSQGVYEAEIQYINPKNQEVLTKKSTMFPDNWSANRVKYEVDMAYKNRVEFVEKGKTMWKGVTPSGVEVKGYKEPKTTVYPVMGDK